MESVCGEDGLNVAGKEVLGGELPREVLSLLGALLMHTFNDIVLREPHSFLMLSSISLSGTPLSDFDLTMLHHLPRLEILFLNSTQIGNEA